MNKEYFNGTRFGFILILIWLILLTGFTMYDKIDSSKVQIRETIVLPPEIELIGDIDYE